MLSAVAVVVALPVALVRGNAAAAETVHGLIGRGREYSADRRAALVVRYPTGIGSALGAMAAAPSTGQGWPPAPGRTAALTRWLWVDPMAGAAPGESPEGNLDDTRGPGRGTSARLRGPAGADCGRPTADHPPGQASPVTSESHGRP